MKNLLFPALAVSACLSCSGAFAGSMLSEPLDHPPSVVVRFADLDLNKEADAHELLDRITYAARRACGPRPDSNALHMMDRWDGCVNDAMAHAIARVHSPILSRVAGTTVETTHLATEAH